MGDAVGLLEKKLIELYETDGDYLWSKRTSDIVSESSVDLMNQHIKMIRYQNEKMLALLKQMEHLVSPINLDQIVTCEQLCDIRYSSLDVKEEEDVVGFEKEVETLLEKLTGTSAKQLKIISITGMAGLGKTTLARTLYNHKLVKYMFDFRAWICVSQKYKMKDLLLSILRSFIDDLRTDEYSETSEQQLGEKLWRKLRGRKYLVVFDDIWDCKVWNDLKMYFPDDKTGSRVLFTCRDTDVQLEKPAHVLRFRTEAESWSIFKKKVFRYGRCPYVLEQYGRVINKKCEGFPLAIVIAAGLVKQNLTATWWEQISESLHSFMVSDPEQYIGLLALSYDHLPSELRPCYLYLGAFPEDYEVPSSKLIWQWIAQGFIHETGSRMLEDVAEDYLMNLIRRSLVMSSKIKADSKVKACRIHDLFRDFCLRKADEENFLSNNYRYEVHCFPLELGKFFQEGGSISIDTYKFLKILDVESILISLFPLDAAQMVNLRYLAIQARDGSPHASISNLINLQMLIISSRKNILVPKTIWNMVNLRHLYIKSGINTMEEDSSFLQATENDGPSALACMQTLSQVNPESCGNILSRTPNLRKLGFCGPLISSQGDLYFPDLGSLDHLEKLKLLNTFSYPEATRSCNPSLFPKSLKQLTLSNIGMNWKDMSSFSLLSNLEVLKLKLHSCIGETWEMGEAVFGKLTVLKLHDLDIKQWVCSRDNFPKLQRLVVHRCLKLESVPMTLGNIYTLELIEVNGCSFSAYESAVKIQKERDREADNFLKVILKVHGKQNNKEQAY